MNKNRLIHLALLSLLLFMQSAVATHDIDHQYQGDQYLGHTEACEVFVTADNHTAIESTPTQLVLATISANPEQHELRQAEFTHTNHYSSRAPPLS
ncbi:MAG: hypothetical protein AAF431_18230 [Pseudomonadota bacterium]